MADITYLPTAEGWLYLAAVMDLYSRQIVGWATSATMTTDQVRGFGRPAVRADGMVHAGLAAGAR